MRAGTSAEAALYRGTLAAGQPRPARPAAVRPRAADNPTDMTASSAGGSVLVVDDDVALARAISAALREAGYRVRAVNKAEEGLRELEKDPPDAIILDFRMPLINGVGFLYRLRELPAHSDTPVMVVTGDTAISADVRDELRELKAELRLKPIGVQELIDGTQSMLERARSLPTPPPA
jgi:DNA-binding response OmpR family regulator